MENAVEALKIAFAVMMLVLALTLSISSFSNARIAIDEIISLRDRETEYTYIEPSENLTRIVGVETVVTSMYRAYEENIEIYFLKANGDEFVLYISDEGENINYIDLSQENFASKETAINHLDELLNDGLYDTLAQYTFEEKFGEYILGSGTTETTKRVITYQIKSST